MRLRRDDIARLTAEVQKTAFSDDCRHPKMAIRENLRLDDRFSWSFTGVVLAVMFGVIGLYTALRENRPNLIIEIDNQADVLDVHRPLQELKLSFRGQDIQEQNLNLRILTIRISNKGREDIIQGQYDQNSPWGVRVSSGQIIEAHVAANNSPYLATNIAPEVTDANTITLRKVIFERDRFVTVEMLILHRKETPPRIQAFGKIAGQDEIAVIDGSAQRGKQGFWLQAFSGRPLVHIARFGVYFILLVLFMAAIAGITALISSVQRSNRRRRMRKMLGRFGGSDEKLLTILSESYVEGGDTGLRRLRTQLNDERGLQRFFAALKKSTETSLDRQSIESLVEVSSHHEGAEAELIEMVSEPDSHMVIGPDGERYYRRMAAPGMRALAKGGFVKLLPEGKVDVDPAVLTLLDSLESETK